jgi:competence protein ComEA
MKVILHITYGVLIGLFAGGIIWLQITRPRGEQIELLPTPTPGLITVYVSGAVALPGVYELPVNSRQNDAIKAAGGFLPGAETTNVNLAAVLMDGQQVDVPGTVDTSHINFGRININTATVDELETLSGIGPTTAQAIVDYRQEHGNFQVIQEIQHVPGVGPATYSLIESYITVGK